MNLNLITNDTSFKNFLFGQDEETIQTFGRTYSDWVVMFMTLFFHDEQLAVYLQNKHEDFCLINNHLQDVVSIEVARFLYSMDKEDLRELYFVFIAKEEIISDLMLLNRSERIDLIAKHLNWKVDDLKRIDLITAN
jgi:hypothetical protein